jgi:hypothetical protein
MTRTEYARLVGRAAAALEEAAKAGQSGVPTAQRALEQAPARVDVQTTPGGTAVHVDNRVLLRQLGKDATSGAKGMRSAAQTLRSLESTLAAIPPVAPGNARQVLRGVLARGEFHESRLERLQRLFYAWLAGAGLWILSHLPDWGVSGDVLAIVAWALLAIAGLVIIIAAMRLLAAPRRRVKRAREPAPSAAVRRAHEWLAEAARAAEAGDYRTAVRAVHMAALTRLDEAGVVSFDSAVTDSRIVRALRERGKHEAAATLAALNRLFALVWYGNAEAREAEYLDADARWGELEALTAT